MKNSSLSDSFIQQFSRSLHAENQAYQRRYPGDAAHDQQHFQPLHTLYGGAHLFKAESCAKIAGLAEKHLKEYAPHASALAKALQLSGQAELHEILYQRVLTKLKKSAVEDFRIDFEDGYGNRPDSEEDDCAEAAALELCRGMKEQSLPPFIGIRVKTLNEELKLRSLRTLDLFVSTVVKKSGGRLPAGFVITLPKIVHVQQIHAFVQALEALEKNLNLPPQSLKMEMMVETTQSLFLPDGRLSLPLFLEACKGRCRGAHFGTYDYTAGCDITAAHQKMDHPNCDFALQVMKVSLAGTGVWLSDGATSVMPVPLHRGEALTAVEKAENLQTVHRAWKMSFDHNWGSLRRGFYQGWDLHPGQIPIRYAAAYAFFLEGLEAASERLRNFIQKAAQATLVGDVFDDAATGQGLLNYFLRALSSGAITEKEIEATGLSLEEVRSKSFLKILQGRRAH